MSAIINLKLFDYPLHIYHMKTTTKATTIFVLSAAALIITAHGAYAREPGLLRNLGQEINASIAPTISAIRNEEKIELRQNQTLKKNIIDQARDLVKRLLPRRIHGKIAAIGTSSLTVASDHNGPVTVNILANTILKRRFGGNSALSEFRVGDEVAVIGALHAAPSGSSSSAAADNSIDARYIRDLSIQKRNTVFVGTILTMGTDSFTVKTQSRGVQTVHVTAGTTTYQERNKAISLSDLKVGDRVLVKGSIWDRAAKDIDAAKVIKLPNVPAGASSSTAGSTSSAASSSVSSSSASSAPSSSVSSI